MVLNQPETWNCLFPVPHSESSLTAHKLLHSNGLGLIYQTGIELNGKLISRAMPISKTLN